MKQQTFRRILAGTAALLTMTMTVPYAGSPLSDTAALTASAADTTPVERTFGDLTYYKYDDHAEISTCNKETEAVEIPSEIEGVPVTIINYEAFEGCINLKEITIPASIQSIGTSAFSNSGLEVVNFPEVLPVINNNAFTDTPWLDARRAENPMVIIGSLLLDGKTCEGDIVIPDTVTYINPSAFDGNQGITSVRFQDTLEDIGMNAFYGCNGLTEITLPESIIEISIGAFEYCTNLKSVTLPKHLQSIRSSAFAFCSSLEEINFPETQVDIYSDVFLETKWLADRQAEDSLVIVNGTLIDGKTCTGDVVIPNGVSIISSAAFSMNTNITSVVIPPTVKDLWDDTFFFCTKLTKIVMPGISYIGPSCFGFCNKITDITVSSALTEIGKDAFGDAAARINVTYFGTQNQWRNINFGNNNLYVQMGNITYVTPGDADGNGACSAADAVVLQKWLLADPDTEIAKPEAADMNFDGKLNAADLSLLKRTLLSE